MPLNSLAQVNLLISFSSCYPCQIHCCSWMSTFMIWLSEQLSSANSVPSSWRNTLECEHHQTSCHLYLFHHLPIIDCILDVHLTTSWRCHWIASSSTAIMFLLENSKSSVVLYFLINLPLNSIFSLSESLFLVHQTLLREVSRSCCSTSTTMCNDNFPCTLINPLWAQTVTRHSRCLSDLGPIFLTLTIIDWHLLVSFGILLSVSGSPRSASNLSTSDIHPIRLTKLLLCYCSIKDLSEYVIPNGSFDESFNYYKQLLRNY